MLIISLALGSLIGFGIASVAGLPVLVMSVAGGLFVAAFVH